MRRVDAPGPGGLENPRRTVDPDAEAACVIVRESVPHAEPSVACQPNLARTAIAQQEPDAARARQVREKRCAVLGAAPR